MENKTETIRFRVSERDVRRIDTLAEQTGHSRSSLLRALIWTAEPANVRPLQVERIRPIRDTARIEPYTDAVPTGRGG